MKDYSKEPVHDFFLIDMKRFTVMWNMLKGFYNRIWIHSSIDYLNSQEFENLTKRKME